MRKLLVLSVILAFSISCYKATGQDQVAKDNKLKSIVVYEEKFNVLVSKKLKESEVTYDEKGYILEEIEYTDGKVTKHFKYQYDKDGNKTREEEYDPAGKLKEYSEYKIENGLRVEKTVYDPNKKMKSKKTYVYTRF